MPLKFKNNVMEKIYSLLKSAVMSTAFALPVAAAAQSQTTVFSENFGNPASEKDELIEDHEWNTNPRSMFSWQLLLDGSSINIRSNNPSDYDGSSAEGNLYFKGCASFIITGIDTHDYKSLQLSFGAFGKNKGDVENMKVECKDGGNGKTSEKQFAGLGLDTGKKKWSKATLGNFVPASNDVTLTFTSNLADLEADGGIRLDDITITGEKTPTGIDNIGAQKRILAINGKSISYDAADGTAIIYNVSGQKIASVEAGSTITLDVSEGVYIIKFGGKTLKAAIR